MSAKSLLRAGLASSHALKSPKSPSAPKSILKRPPPLPLSRTPYPFVPSVTIAVSPSPTSAHVHFPPSPRLAATFSTHSPNSYDRAAISVSPNPLELPSWGSRVYSPNSETFGKRSPAESSVEEELTPKFKTFTPPVLTLTSPNLESFPQSPVDTKPTTRAGARFQAIVSQPSIRSVGGVGDALKAFPRSPYPSAPTPPPRAALAENDFLSVREDDFSGGVWSRTKTAIGSPPPRPSPGGKMKVKKVPPALNMIGRGSEMVSSPLRQEFLTPVPGSGQVTAKSNSNSDSSLTQAFWQSMTLDDSVDMSSPCITTEDPVASGLLSPGGMISPMIFATKDGIVWSPPQRGSVFKKEPSALRKSDSPRGKVMSPSPEDPFAAFPSFAAVLSLDRGSEDSVIAYPPPAVTMNSAV